MSGAFRCRTCGKHRKYLSSKRLFAEDTEILQKIEYVTGLWLTNELNVPGKICSCCLLELNQAVRFRERCIKVNEDLLLENSQYIQSEETDEDPLAYDTPIELDFDGEFESEVNKFEVNQNQDYRSVCRGVSNVSFSEKEDLLKRIHQSGVSLNLSSHDKIHLHRKRLSPSKNIRKNIICDQCGRHFNDKANLNRHLQRHLGIKGFECQECGYRDYSQHLVNLHNRIQHQGEKPYACKYCNNRFANSMARLRHQRSHVEHLETDLKKPAFTCRLCSKTFTKKSSLDKHSVVHTGEEPFFCDICGVYFNRKSSLKTHYRSKAHQNQATLKLDETGVDSS